MHQVYERFVCHVMQFSCLHIDGRMSVHIIWVCTYIFVYLYVRVYMCMYVSVFFATTVW